ncbi:MAG: hypothetical protein ABIT10_02600 [Alteraurantiacibacter sp.]
MTNQTDLNLREQKLAYVLQSSFDFAFRQMAEGKRLIPFATRVQMSGAVDFQREENESTELPLAEVHDLVRQSMRSQAVAGELQAAALVAPIQSDEKILGEGFYQAIRVQLEMADYCRLFFQPYRIEPGVGGEKGKLVMGKLVTTAAEHVIFGEEPTEGDSGRTIFSLT